MTENMTEIHEAMQAYVEMEAEFGETLASIQKMLDEAKDRVKTLVLQHGKTIEHNGLRAEYRQGYPQNVWDGKRLDLYTEEHPELLCMRVTKNRSPVVAIYFPKD